jgi:hypothetical protein
VLEFPGRQSRHSASGYEDTKPAIRKRALGPGRHFRPFLCDTCAGSVWRLVGVYWPPSFVKAELDRRERELGRRI